MQGNRHDSTGIVSGPLQHVHTCRTRSALTGCPHFSHGLDLITHNKHLSALHPYRSRQREQRTKRGVRAGSCNSKENLRGVGHRVRSKATQPGNSINTWTTGTKWCVYKKSPQVCLELETSPHGLFIKGDVHPSIRCTVLQNTTIFVFRTAEVTIRFIARAALCTPAW